jgi:hypothetical protein
MASLVPYNNSPSPLIERAFALAQTLLYRSYYVYYWLRDIAPIIVKYKLRQMGRVGIDRLPLLSWETKQEIKRWLIDYYGL